MYTGVQSINNVYAIVNKVKNVLVNSHIFNLINFSISKPFEDFDSAFDNHLKFNSNIFGSNIFIVARKFEFQIQ